MRTITKEAVRNFFNGTNYRKSNTSVFIDPTGDQNNILMCLHGNNIAIYNLKTKELKVRDCGRRSNTTKERLNGILERFGTGIYQKNWKRYFENNKEWKSKERNVIC